jgi:hypothetical protein
VGFQKSEPRVAAGLVLIAPMGAQRVMQKRSCGKWLRTLLVWPLAARLKGMSLLGD